MIITGARTVPKCVLSNPGLLSNRHGRYRSTKSAIDGVLYKTQFSEGKVHRIPLRPLEPQRSDRDAAQPNGYEAREGPPRGNFAATHKNRHERGLNQSPPRRTYGRPVSQSQSAASNVPRLATSAGIERESGEVSASDGQRTSQAHSSRSSTRWSERYSQREKRAFQEPRARASNQRTRFSGAHQSTDFVGNGRYTSRGKKSHEYQGPLQLPYTTPASEFLYGHSVVTAAIQAQRRKLYKLYINQSRKREDQSRDLILAKQATNRGVDVQLMPPEKARLMDKMSQGRPHNGYILEASPLPKLPVIGFDQVVQPGESFLAHLGDQSREDEEVNGTNPLIKYSHAFPRFPFVLLLDGILDPQNLGAILRSAFFLGVDAVALSTDRTAPLSPAALKASAGASESIPIVTVHRARLFLDKCKNNGWKVYASTAPPSYRQRQVMKHTHVTTSSLISDVTQRPCILILGNEGQGLYRDVEGAAHSTISIEGHRGRGRLGIDSLNVSVAAGLLCEAFLRKPATINEDSEADSDEDGLGFSG